MADSIEITDVQVHPVNSVDGRLLAWVNITLGDAFVVKGMRLINGTTRMFVAMPSRQQKDGSFQDVAHPITQEFRRLLDSTVIQEYHRVARERGDAQ